MTFRTAFAPVCLLAAALALTACGGSDESPASTATVAPTTSISTSSSASSAPQPTRSPVEDQVADEPAEDVPGPGEPGYVAPLGPDGYPMNPDVPGANEQLPGEWSVACDEAGNVTYVTGNPPSLECPGSGAAVRAPEVESEKEAGHSWWAECIAVNDAAFCRENDPWQQ